MTVMGAEVVVCARGWVGTRFSHQGRLKRTTLHKGGVDCLGLLVGVAAELNLPDRLGKPFVAADMTDYSHLPDVEKLRATLCEVMEMVPFNHMQMGDVLLMDVDGRAQHLGIVSESGGVLGLIHAYAPVRGVVEHPLDAWWLARVVAVFRVS